MAQDHKFRVTHAYSGKVAYEGESYMDAAGTQTRENVDEGRSGQPPLWRLWLIDPDGIGVIVQTQQL